MEANVTAFVLNLLFVAICGAQESERCSAAQDNPMLNFQQEPPQEPQCTVRPKTYEKAYPEQDNVQKKSVPVVDNYPHDGARRRQHSNCESQNWNPEAAKHAGHAAFRYKATRGSQKQPLDTVEQVPACKTSQEPTGSPQDGFHVTLLVQESRDNPQDTSQDSPRGNLECIQQDQSGCNCHNGQSPQCSAARQTHHQITKTTKERSGGDGEMTKEAKMRELLETSFLNRSRPITWVDDYNVSNCVKMGKRSLPYLRPPCGTYFLL